MPNLSKVVLLQQLRKVVKSNFEELIDSITTEVREKIKEEYRDEFDKLFDDLEPSIDFLVYWETDTDCQAAVSEVFKAIADLLQKAESACRELSRPTP